MHVHQPGFVSLSIGVFSALSGGRPPAARTVVVAADTRVEWIGAAPSDADIHVVWEALADHRVARYGALIADVGERLFRRDLRRIGGAADVGFFRPLYQAYARELIGQLDGSQVRIDAEAAP